MLKIIISLIVFVLGWVFIALPVCESIFNNNWSFGWKLAVSYIIIVIISGISDGIAGLISPSSPTR